MNEVELNALPKIVLDATFAAHTPRWARVYDGQKLVDVGYRINLLVDNELVIEVKAFEAVAPVCQAQLLSYLQHFAAATRTAAQFQRRAPARWDLPQAESALKRKEERKERRGCAEVAR